MPQDYPDFTFTTHVRTLAADNIIIDKLKVGAYTDRRSTIKNDAVTIVGAAPPGVVTGTAWKGKFFPRGVRGHITHLLVYCKRTGTGTLEIAWSISPSLGEIGSETVTPELSWSWKTISLKKFWHYDSIFIWIKRADADVSVGYDTDEPYDGYTSADNGVTWSKENRRYWFRLIMIGETAGDVPIMGTVNMIEIPPVTSVRKDVNLTVPAGGEAYDVEQFGIGRILWAMWFTFGDYGHDKLYPKLIVDGVDVMPTEGTLSAWNTVLGEATTGGICIGRYDTTAQRYTLIMALSLPYRRSFKVGYKNIYTTDLSAIVLYVFTRRV